MLKWLNHIRFFFPVQLFILHFRKYQVLLIFWVILASTINSGFMQSYGADALFLVPEYLGSTSAMASFIVGVSFGIFIMSWNITTFILHSKRFKFLAASSQPFLKYCINNALLPLLFLIFYIVRIFLFDLNKELLQPQEVIFIVGGLIAGITIHLIFSFAFFFGADKTIVRTIKTPAIDTNTVKEHNAKPDGVSMKVTSYLNAGLKVCPARETKHYSDSFLEIVFKKHHFAGIIGILIAFMALAGLGYLMDNKIFQLPAASSIVLFFSVLIAVIGALNYFFQNWVFLFLVVLGFLINYLYIEEIIDPRNKAYGIDYTNKAQRPEYNKATLHALASADNIAADKQNMIEVLNNWKRKQGTDKPTMIFINVSGGGLRSAAFVMNTLQQLDSASGGKLMKQTFMISGASGGMLAASYMRALYHQKQMDPSFTLYSNKYTDDITQDLLNPIFSSMINRDIFSPAQKFSVPPFQYVKDRGYAFEEKLNANTGGLLNKQFKDIEKDEHNANIPLIVYNSVITSDGRKLLIGTQPMRFLMKPANSIDNEESCVDAVDFKTFFEHQSPMNLRVLTALRMNATFPYVLPNVWLPTKPVVDAMDAGLRDNFGTETALRFIEHFKEWIEQNTSGVLVLQLRDRMSDNWENPMTTQSIADILIKPATILQHNWYKFQDYAQNDQISYMQKLIQVPLHHITFMYQPSKKESSATLNFHITAIEKKDVIASFNSSANQSAKKDFLTIMKR